MAECSVFVESFWHDGEISVVLLAVTGRAQSATVNKHNQLSNKWTVKMCLHVFVYNIGQNRHYFFVVSGWCLVGAFGLSIFARPYVTIWCHSLCEYLFSLQCWLINLGFFVSAVICVSRSTQITAYSLIAVSFSWFWLQFDWEILFTCQCHWLVGANPTAALMYAWWCQCHSYCNTYSCR